MLILKFRLMNFSRLLVLLSVGSLVLAGCTAGNETNQPAETEDVEVLYYDVEDDGIDERFTLLPTDVSLNPEFTDVYPYTFSDLVVAKEDGRELLRINEQGVTVENGENLISGITTQVAYAASIGGGTVLSVVQIDDTGTPVSEPLVLDWEPVQQAWQVVAPGDTDR